MMVESNLGADKAASSSYSAPQLVVYGSVKKLTAAGTAGSNEGAGAGCGVDPLKMC